MTMTVQLDRVAFLVVQSALARAPKHDTDSTGTDYLMLQIADGPLEVWDELRSVMGALAEKSSAKAVGYLLAMAADASEPATWKTSEYVVEASADSLAAAELREAAWSASARGRPLVGWTDEFVATIERALTRAMQRESPVADIRDLAVALVSGPENRATEGLRQGGADVAGAESRIVALTDVAQGIRTPSLDALDHTGALSGQTKKRGFFARLSGGSGGATVGAVVASEAVRQAVRAGAGAVAPEHVAAALASIQDQVTQAGRSWADGTAPVVAVPQARRTDVLIPPAWPNVDEELPRRIASMSSFAEVSAVLG